MSTEPFLYLETVGRQSGLPRRIEIWFVERAGRYYIAAEMRERAQWLQNLKADPRVHVSVGPRGDEAGVLPRAPATARVVDAAQEQELVTAVRALMNAKYEWSDGLMVEITAHG